MGDSLFEGLPPPSAASTPGPLLPPPLLAPIPTPVSTTSTDLAFRADSTTPVSAIRPPATASKRERGKVNNDVEAKRVRFKSNDVEASEEQVLGAIGKIASHIGNPSKFSKASKLAIQLLQSNSVNCNTVDAFFEILRAAMVSPSQATDMKYWADYQALFTAVLEKLECFSPTQKAQIEVWELCAIVANEFRTDDTFVFSKASSRVRRCLDSLPEANEEDELQLKETEGQAQEGLMSEASKENGAHSPVVVADDDLAEDCSFEVSVDSDPFGLDALMPMLSKEEERDRKRKDEEAARLQAHRDVVRLLNERRGALISCLEIAADKYKLQWAQTIIDILVKYAFDASAKFTVSQRLTIEKLWGSIREQLICRKHSKPASGKLDVTPFELLQSQYAREHISIRKSVGSSGERSAEQWLG